MQQCSKSRAYYSYDDDAMAISTLTVHENYKKNRTLARSKLGLKKIQTSKYNLKKYILIGYRDDW